MNLFNPMLSANSCLIRAGSPGVPLPGGELFTILERLFPIRFFSHDRNALAAVAELHIRSVGGDPEIHGETNGRPSLSVPLPIEGGRLIDIEVAFADIPDVPMPFRGRRLKTKSALGKRLDLLSANERVLATSHQGPIWTVTEIDGIKRFRTALPLPQILPEENFSDIFGGERFLEMLPVLHFLRTSVAKEAYQPPPLRAAYIIDDPNLHWSRYGCVDYREVAKHAQRENYHVSFATIPLDTWFTHALTADLFRGNSQWLSLLIHGNNHAKQELAGRYSEAARDALLGQAIQRIQRLEKNGNLHVCRVMVPPHGACSSDMLAALPRHGFESACISAGSLRAHNPDKPWTRTLGFHPAELIEGCPVLPRWAMSGDVENTLLVAAYLGRPMILRGHHGDLKNGVEILDHYAGFIHGLGTVLWSKLSDLSRLNYFRKMDGSTLSVKPLGTRLSIDLPAHATELVVEAFDGFDHREWKLKGADGSVQQIIAGVPVPISEEMGLTVSIERCGPVPSVPAAVVDGHQRTSASLICRRVLAEARDRLLA